ncbi:MAG: hypothetical protein NTV25_03810 [Methanothrix sp.]|nr:hypothetical protein [Methanothrix sp.]
MSSSLSELAATLDELEPAAAMAEAAQKGLPAEGDPGPPGDLKKGLAAHDLAGCQRPGKLLSQ